jgi:RHS repeat-associated protein
MGSSISAIFQRVRKTKNNLLARLFAGKDRIFAVVSFFVMVVGIVIPPASIYTASAQANALNPSADTKMKQNYAGAAQNTVSPYAAAADAGGAGAAGSLITSHQATAKDPQGDSGRQHVTPHELTNKRTATSTVMQNADGSLSMRQYASDHFYKQDNAWQPIQADLIEDTNAADSGNILGKALGKAESLFTSPDTFKMKANQWQARFAASDDAVGMVRLQYQGQTITIRPKNAASVTPYTTTDSTGRQTVHYDGLWPGINVEYETQNDMLREFVSLLGPNATNNYSFAIDGASLVPDPKVPGGFKLKGALENTFSVAPLTVTLMDRGVISETVTKQQFQNGALSVRVDPNWLKTLPKANFPVVIDPSFGANFGNGSYTAYKSDNYVCSSSSCYMDAGTLNDAGYWKSWQTILYVPFTQLQGQTLTNATFHLQQMPYTPGRYFGVYDTHTVMAWHAACGSFNCLDGSVSPDSCTLVTACDMDVTNLYQRAMNIGDWGTNLMLTGEQSAANSLKMFDPYNTYINFSYLPPAPTIAAPVQNQVFTDPQASFTVNPIGGYQYSFTVSSAPGATGTLVTSGPSYSTQWTVPDGVLQNGSTYYVQARTFDPGSGAYSYYGPSVPFRIDMRTGSDKTQVSDTVGPVAVDLATGNVSTSATSHTSTALGGALGVSLNYNSPLKSRAGLVGDYYGNTAFTGDPTVSKLDQTVDFSWADGAPASGVPADNFGVRWQGYFVAPTTGDYYFGGIYDDTFKIYVNDQLVMNGGSVVSSTTYGSSVHLQAGQVSKIKIEMTELGGPGGAQLWVKGAVNEQKVPSAWLQSGVRQLAQSNGLIGHYYNDNGSHSFTDPANTLFLQRTDPSINFNWGDGVSSGDGSPIPGGPKDNFLARWTGYLTVPTGAGGSYTFGTNSDDGSRITIGTDNTQVFNKWNDSGMVDAWGNPINLTGGQSVPITIDYFEHGGGAAMTFEMLVNGQPQVVPSSWLSPQAPVLPNGWQLGIDADGSVGYEHLTANQNDVLLTDSAGNTHDYTWDAGKQGYKPPANEDGNLTRNNDGTFTLLDSDGRTYLFAVDGNLSSVTSAADDRNPAALKYSYGTTLASGGPVAIKQITDGVDPSRWAKVYYSGDSNCGAAAGGFDAAPPANMLCAVATNDGRVTSFYYYNGQLARISQPGNVNTDFQYETVNNSAGQPVGARLNGVWSAAASDVIAAGQRSKDATTETQITYDTLGRAAGVTAPAANTGDTRQQQTFEYLPGTIGYQNGVPATGYYGVTQEHVTGAPEPNGFMRRVEYDNLFRTTRDTDNSNLSATSLWDVNKDLLYSASDPTGNMSTTVYDDEDRAATQYGPAPRSWFATATNALTGNTEITPQAGYASQVPRSDTAYDQGITGTAVAWYAANSNTGSFSGAPVAHTTGINPSVDPTWLGRNFQTTPLPTNYGLGTDYGFSATGKVRFPGTGTYNFKAWEDDGIRVWIDDKLVVDDWGARTEGIAQNVPSGNFDAVAGKAYRFRFDYIHFGTAGAEELWITGPNIPITDQTNQLGTSHPSFVSPDYSLPTSVTASDSTLGNTTTTTNYGSTPELGLPQSTSVDPTGKNLVTSSSYEAQGSGYLRQTSKALAGGDTTSYSYYGATETRANPCVAGSPAVSQSGMQKLTVTQDPDGSGSQTGVTTEAVYDASGRVVASRLNADSWTCASYDSRGRVTQYTVPSATGRTGRTVTTNYAVGGNPLISSVTDSVTGTNSTQIDLLGRTVSTTDVYGNQTTLTYDSLGRPVTEHSLKGTETVGYDNLGRITTYSLDSTVYATITYDQYNRVASVTYPQAQNNGQALKLNQVKYDATQTNVGSTYNFSDGSTYDETVGRTAQTGTVTSDTITQGGKTVTSSYQYDSVGRLTAATIDNWQYQYGFGTQAASCASLPGYNANASKDGNRTSYTVTNTTTGTSTTTNNCYNIADRLVNSTDAQIGTPVYDAYGNITQFAGGSTPISFVYNASNQNTSITQGTNHVDYVKDPSGNVLARKEYKNGALSAAYRTIGGVLQTCSLSDTTQCSVTDKYISLPGGVQLTIPASPIVSQTQQQSAPANTLPSPWMTFKSGPAAQQGSASYANGAFTVSSSGEDMWGSLDQEQLATQTLEGDGQIVARLTSQTATDDWAKAGIIIKNKLGNKATYQSLAVTPGNGVRYEYGYNTDLDGPTTYNFPNVWLKLVRAGNVITAYTSTDGATWTQAGTHNTSFLKTVQIGLFALSGSPDLTSTATFDHVSVTPATASTLPSGWTNGDTGNPPTPVGTSTYASGVYTLKGRDGDVWDDQDQAQRAYQTMTGDGQIVTRVASQTNSNEWAKAGIFMKASPADMSNYASLHVTPGNNMQMEWNYSNDYDGGSYTLPNTWLKLVRSGNTITGYRSSNGTAWTQVTSETDNNLPATVMVGLLMVSGDQGVTGTATYDNVSITQPNTQTQQVSSTAVYSIQNFHGDTAITVGQNGLPTSAVTLYDPFGQAVNSGTFGTSGTPQNATNQGMGWAASPVRKQENMFSLAVMQMGARVYVPSLGRFTQMDPVDGGTPNPYVYVLDPVNFADYSGQFGWGKLLKNIVKAVVIAIVVVAVVVLIVAALPEEFVAGVIGAVATVATRAASIISSASAGISRGASAIASAAKGAPKVMGTVVNGASNFFLKSTPVVTESPSTTSAYQKGLAGLQAANVTQNAVRIPSLSGTASYRVPDFLAQSGSKITAIGEVKNVQYQSLTRQLNDFILYAQSENIPFSLQINGTARLSQQLQGAVDSGQINLITY